MSTDSWFIWHMAGAVELPWQNYDKYGGNGTYIYKYNIRYGDGYGYSDGYGDGNGGGYGDGNGGGYGYS